MLLLKAVARLVELCLMAAIALIGLGVGLYCLDGLVSLGSARPDRLLHLPAVRDRVGHFLTQMEAPGSVAVLALVCAIAAIVIGLLLIVGLLGRRRERLLIVERDGDRGGLYARTRAVGQMVRTITEQTPGVTGTQRPKLRLRRSGQRASLTLVASRGPDSDGATVDRAVHERVDPITSGLNVNTHLRVRLVRPKERSR